MPNSSFIYTTDATSAQLATPYIRAPTELREIDWEAFRLMGPNMGPAGQTRGGQGVGTSCPGQIEPFVNFVFRLCSAFRKANPSHPRTHLPWVKAVWSLCRRGDSMMKYLDNSPFIEKKVSYLSARQKINHLSHTQKIF